MTSQELFMKVSRYACYHTSNFIQSSSGERCSWSFSKVTADQYYSCQKCEKIESKLIFKQFKKKRCPKRKKSEFSCLKNYTCRHNEYQRVSENLQMPKFLRWSLVLQQLQWIPLILHTFAEIPKIKYRDFQFVILPSFFHTLDKKSSSNNNNYNSFRWRL